MVDGQEEWCVEKILKGQLCRIPRQTKEILLCTFNGEDTSGPHMVMEEDIEDIIALDEWE